MTHLPHMTLLAILATEILATDIAANMHFALDFVLQQCQIIGTVHVTKAAPLVIFIFVSLHIRLLGEATGAVLISAWNFAVMFGRFGKLACVHGLCWLESLGNCRRFAAKVRQWLVQKAGLWGWLMPGCRYLRRRGLPCELIPVQSRRCLFPHV